MFPLFLYFFLQCLHLFISWIPPIYRDITRLPRDYHLSVFFFSFLVIQKSLRCIDRFIFPFFFVEDVNTRWKTFIREITKLGKQFRAYDSWKNSTNICVIYAFCTTNVQIWELCVLFFLLLSSLLSYLNGFKEKWKQIYLHFVRWDSKSSFLFQLARKILRRLIKTSEVFEIRMSIDSVTRFMTGFSYFILTQIQAITPHKKKRFDIIVEST